MKPSEALALHRETIRRIVLESGMTNPRVFGSALHGDDTEDSDLDILVDRGQSRGWDIVDLQLQLEDLLCRKVDVRLPTELHRTFRDHVVAESRSL